MMMVCFVSFYYLMIMLFGTLDEYSLTALLDQSTIFFIYNCLFVLLNNIYLSSIFKGKRWSDFLVLIRCGCTWMKYLLEGNGLQFRISMKV